MESFWKPMTVQRWERFDLDLPDDFPVPEIDVLHSHLSDYVDDGNKLSPEWREWAGGLNGLVYRFRACDEHGGAVTVSLADTSPPQPKRYEQERDLYSFFAEGLSAVECFYYGLYFIGTHADANAFPYNVDRRDVTPRKVAERFEATYGGGTLADTLLRVVDGDDFKVWSGVRNYLSHRGAPGRTHYEGGGPPSGVEWNLGVKGADPSVELTVARLTARRQWLGATVSEIATHALAFAKAHVDLP
jgi:hypothetical protein